MIDALITNGQVIDGSGSPRFFAAVAVSGDTVTIHRDGEVPYRLIAQTMSPSGREFYPLTRSEHLDVLAFRPYTSQPNIGNVLASCMSMWNLLERSTLRPLSMSSVATLVLALSRGEHPCASSFPPRLTRPLNKSQYPRPGVCRTHAGMTVAGSVRIREAVVEMPSPYSYGNSPYHRPTISSTCAATSSDTSALNAATRWQIPRSVPSQSSE